jgi:hypothetical protein
VPKARARARGLGMQVGGQRKRSRARSSGVKPWHQGRHLQQSTPECMLKLRHQGRHLRLSCLGAANGSACVLYQLEAQIYKAAWPPWQRENYMAQPGNSPSFANLRMTSGWVLGSDIDANCDRRGEEEGADSRSAGGMPGVFIEGAR